MGFELKGIESRGQFVKPLTDKNFIILRISRYDVLPAEFACIFCLWNFAGSSAKISRGRVGADSSNLAPFLMSIKRRSQDMIKKNSTSHLACKNMSPGEPGLKLGELGQRLWLPWTGPPADPRAPWLHLLCVVSVKSFLFSAALSQSKSAQLFFLLGDISTAPGLFVFLKGRPHRVLTRVNFDARQKYLLRCSEK